jgi:hypothetical protein
MSENSKSKVRTVTGLPGSVARFKRSRDGLMIFVFPRRKKNESRDAAVQRVLKLNGGAKEDSLEYCV